MNFSLTLTSLVFVILLNNVLSDMSISYLSDHELEVGKKSNSGMGVIVMHKKEPGSTYEKTIEALGKASETLNSFGASVHLLDCNVSNADICQDSTKMEKIILYKSGDVVKDLPIDTITSQVEAEGNILHWLNSGEFVHIGNKDEWKNIMNECNGRKNIVFVYMQGLGTTLHNYFVKAALAYKDHIQIAYTTDYQFAMSLMSDDKLLVGGGVWFSMCAEGVIDGSCITVKYPKTLLSSTLSTSLNAMMLPTTTVVRGDDAADKLRMAIDEATHENVDVIMLIAPSQKLNKAINIARHACTYAMGQARCVVIDGDVKISGISDYVDESRIYLSLLSMEGQDEDIEVGYLNAETNDEVVQQWRRLDSARIFRDQIGRSSNDQPSDRLLEKDPYENPDDFFSVNDVQDDPMAYSVHSNKALRDLYLYDYKTIPRLTDVTYDELITSNQYAVILFTLEFNAKALAVMSTFVRIHKQILATGDKSPMYRVECFDWPDVCKKADFVTFPRMVFYRANEERSPIEYLNIWSEEEMSKAVKLYSMQWPITVETVDDLKNIGGMSLDWVYGLVSTSAGEMIFKDVARSHGDQLAFVMVKGEAASFIASGKGVSCDGKDMLMAATSDGFLPVNKLFKSVMEVEDFIQKSFYNEPLKELTASNFGSLLLNNPKPLFIQYKNMAQPSSPVQHLTDNLIKLILSGDYNDKADFVWMDSSPKSPGEYTLYMHSNGQHVDSPLAYFNKKGSVSIKSFESNPNEEAIRKWVEDCLSGAAATSFKLINQDWKPRLPGHDFLRYMSEEGSLPSTAKLPSGGATQPSLRHYGNNREHASPSDEMVTMNSARKPLPHSEL